MKLKLLPLIIVSFACFQNTSRAEFNSSDYDEFALQDLGFSIGLNGLDKSISYYFVGFDVSNQGIVTGGGHRKDIPSGSSLDLLSTDVSVESGNLGVPQTEIDSESFVRRISGRNVTLLREVRTKMVPASVTLSDGGVIKGIWSFNQKREQTAVWRKGRWVYSWKSINEWYAGHFWGWFNDRTGTTGGYNAAPPSM
jgi:hypothetical protein